MTTFTDPRRAVLQDQARKATELANHAAVAAAEARERADQTGTLAAKLAFKLAETKATHTRREADAAQAKLLSQGGTVLTDC